jgi:hypothetical protein
VSAFWKSLLKTFLGDEVCLSLRGNKELVGTLEELGSDSGRIRKLDGSVVLFEYFDVKQCEAAK